MKKTALYSAVLFALPVVAFAQALQPVKNLVAAVGQILNMLIPLLIALAIVAFFWGLVVYIWQGRSSEEAHQQGIRIMIAGLVSLFVMVSVWGLVALAQGALGVQGNASFSIPQIPQSTGN